MACSTDIKTGNSPNVFKSILPNFKGYTGNPVWKKPYAPYCDSTDGDSVQCQEYENVPFTVSCDEGPPTHVQRLCHCVNKGKTVKGIANTPVSTRHCFGADTTLFGRQQRC